MADLSPVEKAVIAGIIAPAFSKQRGKAFTLPSDHEELERRFSCDVVLRAEDGEVVQVEHTRAAGDEGDKELERVRPDRGGRVHDLLQECLNAHDARGAIITLVTDPPPAKRQDQERLAGWLCGFILKKLREGRQSYFALDVVEDWDGYLSFVAEWVKKLVIAPTSPDSRAGVISSTSRMAHLIDTTARFREALERKANRYGASAADVILLVDFDTSPLDHLDVPEVLEVARTTRHPFREIWALNNFPGRQACRRLWPPPTPAETTQDGEAPKEDPVVTDQDLAQLFADFNARYFGGRLPTYRIQIEQSIPGVASSVSRRIDAAERVISLRQTDDARALQGALLHEMVHAVAGEGHGRPFFDELKRLLQMGATLVGDDDVSDMEYEQFAANEDLKEAARRIRDEEAAAQEMTHRGE